MTGAFQPIANRRRWLRFSLRTLLVVMTVLCVWLGFKVNAARRQKEAVDAILKAGGFVNYDYELAPVKSGKQDDFPIYVSASPPAPEWMRKYLGDEYFQDVIGVRFANRTISESDLAQLAKLPELIWVYVFNTRVVANSTGISRSIVDVDLVPLKHLSRLRSLVLTDTDIDGSGLADIARLKQFSRLRLQHSNIGDAGMEQIGKMTALKSLFLANNRITDASLEHLQNLTNLETLDLGNTGISDRGLQFLKGLKELGTLSLEGSRVTPGGVRELQKSLPNTKITGP